MNDNANTAPVVYVVRSLNYDPGIGNKHSDWVDECLSSGSVWATKEKAQKAVRLGAMDDFMYINEGLHPSNEDYVAWEEPTVVEAMYQDYAGKHRWSAVYTWERIMQAYRIIEVELQQ